MRSSNRLSIRPSGFDRSTNPTEVVELPPETQNRLVKPDGLGVMALQLEDLVRHGIPASSGSGFNGRLRQECVTRNIESGAGGLQVGFGNLQVCVGREGFLQQ